MPKLPHCRYDTARAKRVDGDGGIKAAIWGGALSARHGAVVCCCLIATRSTFCPGNRFSSAHCLRCLFLTSNAAALGALRGCPPQMGVCRRRVFFAAPTRGKAFPHKNISQYLVTLTLFIQSSLTIISFWLVRINQETYNRWKSWCPENINIHIALL